MAWFRRSSRVPAGENSGTSTATAEKPLGEEQPASAPPPEEPAADDAALKEFLLKNFLSEELPAKNPFVDEPARMESVARPDMAPPEETSSAEEDTSQTCRTGTADLGLPLVESLRDFFVEVDPPTDEAPPEIHAEIIEEHPLEASAAVPPISSFRAPSSDWAFEERLASHKEWVESQGAAGKKVDLTEARLEGADLISVNLRYADLHAANLKSADLLMADLRDTCLTRANLQESCLVGANLEAANLEGASLESAMGLVARQLAGANLRDASLPPQILEFTALPELERAARTALRYFIAILSVSGLSCLMVWKTKDAQLLMDSSLFLFLHSPAAASALPTAEIFLIVPCVLFLFYLVFQFHLQRIWDAVVELPAIFPSGRVLGDREPRIIKWLLRAHFRWMNQDAPSSRFMEKALSVLLAYWLAPVILLVFWARYLTRQDLHGTALHELLAVIALGIAFYSTTKVGRPQQRWTLERKRGRDRLARVKNAGPVSITIGIGVILTFLAVGTIRGIPHDKSRATHFASADVRRWAPAAFWSAGFDPYADLTEAEISQKPANWTGDDSQVPSVKGARLNGAKFRYAQAYGVFLVNAHLLRSDFQGAFLSQADFRGADMAQANLRYAILESARMNHANLDRAQLYGANLSRADLRDASMSYSSFVDATLVDARLEGASLYSAQLGSATLIRANLEKTDLRDAHLENANLEHADLQQAYLWSAKLSGADMQNAHLENAIFIGAAMRNADLRGARLTGTVLNDADLAGAILDDADLRGAPGLTASQVCSAKSRNGILIDATLQEQVDAQCGTPHQTPAVAPDSPQAPSASQHP